MDYISELAAIAKTHGGIIQTKIAAECGISKAMLYKLCKENKIHRIAKGQYILPDEMQDELFLHLETGMSHDLEMKEMN